ncbi:hypothetical protein LCGC14_1305330, partial [marine sediment metagenome]
QWGAEYTSMPELENSLIYYGNDGYDSGILSQYLTGEDDLLGEDEFDSEFSGNYLDSVYISNPIISERFDFSKLYESTIHSTSSIYNNQEVLVKNRITDYNLNQFSAADSGIFQTGELPTTSIYQAFQDSTLREIEYALSDWNEYIALKMDEQTTYELDFTFKLPVIDRVGLNSIQVAFDSSIVSSSINNEFPLSLRIYNEFEERWESLPLAPTSGGYYNPLTLDYDFWASWDNPPGTPQDEGFRPYWGTIDSNNINTISFGINYPYEVTDGNVWFDETQFNASLGASFLDVTGSENHDLNSFWSFNDDLGGEHHKVLYYDNSYNTNKFQFDNLIIFDPNDLYFYTSLDPFPKPDPLEAFSQEYTSDQFYDYFLNNDNEFRLQLITQKEVTNPSDAYLCVGDFKTFVYTDNNYLNYDDFDSNVIPTLPMQQVSDAINFNIDAGDPDLTGLNLKGESGFNIKESDPLLPIFHETFNGDSWNLAVSNPTIVIDSPIAEDAYIQEEFPQWTHGWGDIYVKEGVTWNIGISGLVYEKSRGLIKLEYPYLDLGYTSNSIFSFYVTETTGNNVLVYHTTDFSEGSVNWNNQPATTGFQSQFIPSYGRQEVDVGAPSQYYKLISEEYDWFVENNGFYGFVFAGSEAGPEPSIRHYLSKSYQGSGIAYMQTDISESLSLMSPLYSSATTIEEGDLFVIKFKTSTPNQVKLNLYNGGQKLTEDFEVVPNANSNFDKQVIYLTPNPGDVLTFDQLEFAGNFNPEENFIVYDIKVYKQGQTQQTLKDSRNYDFLEQTSPQYPLLNYGSTTSGNPSSAHLSDDDYWVITSANGKVELDFLFEGESNVQDLEKLEISFEATSSITLDGNIAFSYYNYLSGAFEPLSDSYSLVDNIFLLTLFNDDFNKIKDPADLQYKLLLKTNVTDSDQFTLSIDSLTMKALEVWSVEHDLYKASFKFTPLNLNGEIRLFLNRDIYTIINQYTQFEVYTISFYYDTTAREWWIYREDTSNPAILLAGPISDLNPIGITPRIESHFASNAEGINVISIESQYYKKIETQNDFENYKTLINSYKEGSFTDSFNIDGLDSLLIAENTFSQISSDIDIIYDFKDDLAEENIFNKNLIHTENSDFSDNRDSLITTPYNYQEETVLPLYSPSANFDKTFINGDTGAHYGVSQGDSAINLESDDGVIVTAYRSEYTNAEEFDTPGAGNGGNGGTLDPAWTTGLMAGNHRGYPRKPVMTDPHLTFTRYGGTNAHTGYDVPGWSQWEDDLTSYYNIDGQTGGYTLHVYEEMTFFVGQAPGSVINFEFNMGFWADSNRLKECRIEIWDYAFEDWHVLIDIPWMGYTTGVGMDWYYATLPSPYNWFIDGNFEVKIRIHSNMLHNIFLDHGWLAVSTNVARVIAEYYPESSIEFTVDPADYGKDYYLFYEGRTKWQEEEMMDFYINGVPSFTLWDQYSQHSKYAVLNLDELKVNLGEQDVGWIFDRELDSDYLYLVDMNQDTNIPIFNTELIPIDSSLSKSSTSVQGTWDDDDPFLGATMKYTLENTINTPIFGRSAEQIYTQLELESIELEFDVFPSTDSELLQDGFIEGKDVDKYNIQTLDYAIGRFKNTAIDDAQIPLVTPIELDFGQ